MANKKNIQEIEIPYTPRPLQLELHTMLDKYRFNVLVMHRRFGKTVCVINHLLRAAIMETKPNGRYAYISPSYRQSKSIAWDYLKTFAAKIPNTRFHETELRCDLPNGSRITLLGAENPASLRGIYLDFCAMDEVSQMPASIFPEVIRPALSDRKGSCVFIGTPHGTQNYFYDLWDTAAATEGWNRCMYKASETNLIDEEELAAARATMSIDQYNQEFETSWVANIQGSIYGKEIQAIDERGQICEVPYDPALKVSTFWDIGFHDSTSIFFAQVTRGGAVHVIDHYEASGEAFPFYAKMLQEKADEYDWQYAHHYGPHDLAVTELGTGKTRIEAAQELGIRFRIVPRLSIEDGIHALRLLLPRCYFDRAKLRRALEALRHHHRKWDEKARTLKSKPVKDFSSHAADAARYMAVALQEDYDSKQAPQAFADSTYNPFEARI